MSVRAPGSESAHVDTFTRDSLPAAEELPVMDYSVLPELAAYPSRINCAAELVDRGAEAHADRPAFHHSSGAWTYGELGARVDRIAGVLVDDLGLVPGNRVLLRGPNHPMLAACWLAVVKAGGVAVTTMPLLRAGELVEIAERARIELALCDARAWDEMEAALQRSSRLRRAVPFNASGPAADAGRAVPLEERMKRAAPSFEAVDTAADDVCIVAFTSGSTGAPKGTMHFHRDVMAICDCFPRSTLQASSDDVFCGSPPIGFTFGLGGLVTFPLRVGASSVLTGHSGPEALLETVERHRATVLVTAPTAYRAMLEIVGEHDLSSLTRCVSAGEPLPKPTWEEWKRATGLGIIDGIGTTEMLHIFISAAGDEIRPGATGRPIPGYQARVVDSEMRRLPAGEVGRLAVRGPTGCRYLADERQREYVVDGWNLTGDAYVMDEDGYFWCRGRTDDLIVSSGYNISAAEVEAALLAHDAVAECAVVAAPDERRGSIVKAFVVVRDQHASAEEASATSDDLEAELQEFVKQRIAPYKYPRAIELVADLPRTQTGKIQRFKLRQRESGPA